MARDPAYRHGRLPATGVLLVNLGTPTAPTPSAVRRYLAEFLWDARVVEAPRLLWWLVLHGVILRVRPGRVARNYAKIWSDEGSPLLAISRRQAALLQERLEQRFDGPVKVALGMRYGEPSIAAALEQLRGAGVERLLVLPLYVPVLIFGALAVNDAAAGLDVAGHLYFLAALLVFSATLSPLATAAAVRISIA